MVPFLLNGLGVALATPFNNDYSIDFEALERLIEHIISGGADYLVVLGTTAETPTLNPEERILITDFVRETVNHRLPLVLGIGGNCTSRVVWEIQNRNLKDYSAILSVTPYYNRPTQEGLYIHYRTVADSSKLPLILYNVPGRTGVNLEAETTLRLAGNIDKIVGIKEASGNKKQVQKILKEKPDNFMVISGDDAATHDLIKMGACGVISVLANAFTNKIKTLVDLCCDEKFEQSERKQNELKELIHLMFADGNPAGVKCALSQLGIIKNILRLPLVPVSPAIEAGIRELMVKI